VKEQEGSASQAQIMACNRIFHSVAASSSSLSFHLIMIIFDRLPLFLSSGRACVCVLAHFFTLLKREEGT